ncbi:MAG: RsmD family RNA methyltransferase [Sphingomonadales bacterium]
MRIIGGEHGGRRFTPPPHMPHTRPTTDIAKEGLFNMLQNRLDFETIKTLDLFGGTGSISYELASRGVAELTIVEKDATMHRFITQTAEALKLTGFTVVRSDVFKFITQCNDTFDFIFAGPPYALTTIDELPRLVVEHGLLRPGGIFVLEHTPRNDYRQFKHYQHQRNYGTTVFSFFVN